MCDTRFSKDETHSFLKVYLDYAERKASKYAWFFTLLVLGLVASAGVAGYVFYRYRLRVSVSYRLLNSEPPTFIDDLMND